MKTAGLQVLDGYLLATSFELAKSYGQVPAPFWARLKDSVTRAGRRADFDAEAEPARRGGPEAERALFTRWVGLLGLAVPTGHYEGQQLWPWTRGWTPEHVDAYLAAPSHLSVVRESTL